MLVFQTKDTGSTPVSRTTTISSMKNAIILHGKPTQERYENLAEPKPHEANWLPWLGRQLSKQGVEVSIPALPRPYFPVYTNWKEVFEVNHIDKDTALIGHSAGAEFILRWLSENKDVSVEQVALVAPYHDFSGKYGEFSQYDIDVDLPRRVGHITVLNSLDDDTQIQTSVERISTSIPEARIVELDGYGHFRIGHNMQTEELPVLLDVL
jgi:predicted alpha/beta hydrolase family esterase